MQTQTSNTLHNAIIEAGSKDHLPMLAPDKQVPDSDGNLTTTTERVFETYKNVKQDIRDQLNAEAGAVQIILTGIDNDICLTVDACPNACEMWKAIERLKQGESINVQDLETNLYWEFGKFTSQDDESLESYYSRFYKMMNELIRNQCKNQELKTVSYHKLYDILKQHQHEVNEIQAEKIARVANPLALVAQQQPVYHPQTHPTHHKQNSSTRSQQAATKNRGKAIDNSPRINRNAGYESQRIGNVAGAKETVGSSMVQKSGIQYNCKEFRHGEDDIVDQIDQNDEDADLSKGRELLASLIEKLKCEIDESKNRNKFLETSNKKSQAELKRRDSIEYASEMELECAKIKLYKTREDKELEKVIELENKVKVLDNIVYKIDQLVQMMNMLNNKCRTSFVKPEYLKKAKQANPHLYDIGCYNDNLALMLAPESDEVIRLEKESR
nr:hypothetical protein [Tanacetum cinerariifolium]